MSGKKSKQAIRNSRESIQNIKRTVSWTLLAAGLVLAAWVGYTSATAPEKKLPEEIRQEWIDYLDQGDNCVRGDFPILNEGIPTGEVREGCLSSGPSYFYEPSINITHDPELDSGGYVPVSFIGKENPNGVIEFVAGAAFGQVQINDSPLNPMPADTMGMFMDKELLATAGMNYVLAHIDNAPELVLNGSLNTLGDLEALLIAGGVREKNNVNIKGGAIEVVPPSPGPYFSEEEKRKLEELYKLNVTLRFPYDILPWNE
jgi:hypothetical protein